MKHCYNIFISFVLTVIFLPTCYAEEWANIYGGSGHNEGWYVQQTVDGGYIVAGNTAFGGSTYDMWLIKLNSEGSIDWQKKYGQETLGWSSDERIKSIHQTSDNGYIVTGISVYKVADDDYVENIWLIKLNANGSVAWQKTYGGSSPDHPFSIQPITSGGYILAGMTTSYDTEGGSAFWILRLSPNGSIDWQKTYDATSSRDNAHTIIQTSDGGYLVAGVLTESHMDSDYDIWILKLNSDGSINWQKSYGGDGEDRPWAVKQTADSGYIVAGDTKSFGGFDRDFWILKLNLDGTINWQKRYDGGDTDVAWSLQNTTDGGYIIAGDTQTPGGYSRNGLVLKLRSDGSVDWQKAYGGDYGSYLRSIQLTEDGGYVVTGNVVVDADIWVLKLDSNGDIPDCNIVDIGTISAANTNAEVNDTNIFPKDSSTTPADTTAIPPCVRIVVTSYEPGRRWASPGACPAVDA